MATTRSKQKMVSNELMPQVNREIVDFRRAEERLGRRYQPGNFPGANNLCLSGRNLAAGACANQARA